MAKKRQAEHSVKARQGAELILDEPLELEISPRDEWEIQKAFYRDLGLPYCTLILDLPAELMERLVDVADRTHQPVEEFVLQAIERRLKGNGRKTPK